MKTAGQVSEEKLRGGFYSPASLVQVCLDRVATLRPGDTPLRVLEPSAGDGAFVRGLSAHALAARVTQLTAVELLDAEAAKCREALHMSRLPGDVVVGDVLGWAARNNAKYDVAVGNPPFVRFQFVPESYRVHTEAISQRLGVSFKGVSNLWLPVFGAALDALAPGGVFSFILPAESFTGVAGHEVREWLLTRTARINVDLFAPGSFPGVLQEVVVVSGQILGAVARGSRDVHMREHGPQGVSEWTHRGIGDSKTWTRYLLSEMQLGALEEAKSLASVSSLGRIAKFEVATVTGANDFFCVDDSTVEEFALAPWARPLLPRVRHATGLQYTDADHEEIRSRGLKAHLLDFAQGSPDAALSGQPRRYLDRGNMLGLRNRYKCRIRRPWYRVPVVAPGALLMAKRSHLFPRVIVNEAGVLTTDTIYRGRLLPGEGVAPRDFAAGFHNSLTLLSAEVEGRSFGGGVLELVPSEISRLLIPLGEAIGEEFDRLDWVSRSAGGEDNAALVRETDDLVVKKVEGLTSRLMDALRSAHEGLQRRRLVRN